MEEPGNGQACCFRAECIQSQKARGSQADELRHLALTLTAKLLEPLSCNATICYNATSAGKFLRVTRGLHLLSLGPARAQSFQAAGTALLHCNSFFLCSTRFVSHLAGHRGKPFIAAVRRFFSVSLCLARTQEATKKECSASHTKEAQDAEQPAAAMAWHGMKKMSKALLTTSKVGRLEDDEAGSATRCAPAVATSCYAANPSFPSGFLTQILGGGQQDLWRVSQHLGRNNIL